MKENYQYTLIKKLEKRDKKGKGNSFLKAVFAPYYFVAEYYCKKKIWNNFIFPKMITTDEVFGFLDKQDFEIRGKRFVKMDMIEDSRYDFKDLNQSKKLIFQDYSDAMLAILRKNIPFDVENFMNLHVDIDDKIVESTDGEIYHSLVYYVWIQYWRETRFRESVSRFIKWVIAFICLVSCALFLLRIFSVI